MLIKMIGGEKRNVPAAYALRLLEQGKAVRVEALVPEKPVEPITAVVEKIPQPEVEQQAEKEPAPAKRKAKKETVKAE